MSVTLSRRKDREGHSTLRSYDVLRDGEVVGVVERVSWYAERRTPGRMYVNARWKAKSPRWEARRVGDHGGSPGYDRRQWAVDALLRWLETA
jgi:hypothetical protein